MGWNTLDARSAACAARRHSARSDGPARLFRALLSSQRRRTRRTWWREADYGGPITAIVGRDTMVGTQFHPEKSQRLGLALIAQFPEVEAVILFPAIDLKDGRRAPRAGRHGAGDRVQPRSRRASARLRDAGLRISPRRRSRRRLCRQADERARRSRRILETVACRCSSAAASATCDGRGWLDKGVDRVIIGTAAVRDPALGQGGREEISRPRRGRPRRARRQGRGRGLGRDLAASPCSRSRGASRTPASPPSSTPTSPATACCKGLNLDATIELADAISIPVIASGGLASIDDVKALLQPRAKKLAGAIAGRALYDGRLDRGSAGSALIRSAREDRLGR